MYLLALDDLSLGLLGESDRGSMLQLCGLAYLDGTSINFSEATGSNEKHFVH